MSRDDDPIPDERALTRPDLCTPKVLFMGVELCSSSRQPDTDENDIDPRGPVTTPPDVSIAPTAPTASIAPVGPRVARRRRLAEVASAQHGLFADRDAVACGYERSARAYQRRSGNWLPTAAPGIWRLADLPRQDLEELHAWSRWLGPSWALTSWSTLEALGLVARDARRPVHVVRSAGTGRGAGANDTRTRRRQLDDARWSGALVVHRVHQPRVPPVRRDDLATRPVDEALCLVVAAGVGTGDALPLEDTESLLADLLARGAVDRAELMRTASVLGAPRLLDLLWER